jgi:hypothetical protein
MRVTIEVASGPAAGKKSVLGAHQLIEVGRTDWADLAIRDDPRMSSRHFRLETEAAGCYVEDLGSSNGTCVNGVRITQRTALKDGDHVTAGETQFVIRIQGGSGAEASLPLAAPQGPSWVAPSVAAKTPRRSESVFAPQGGRPASAEPPAPAPQPADAVAYAVETCSSGLTLCRGTVAQIPPAELAVLLCQFLPVYLIVDFRKLGAPLPAELQSPRYLFDWLDPAAAAAVSPVLVAQDELLTWPNLVAQGWGKDAVICLFSNQEKGALLEHVRGACRANRRTGGDEGSVLGCCWPSLLGALLSHFAPNVVRDLMAGIDAVLVESLDPPDAWRLYGPGQVTKMLDQLGFRRQEG